MVETLSDTIVLQSVMNSKLLLHSSCLEIHNKLLSKVLSTTIRVQCLDSDTVLGMAPSLELLVGGKGFALLAEEVQVREVGLVICERDIVTSSSKGLDGSWSPYIYMHLSSKFFGTLASMLLGDRLPGGLRIDTGLTEGRFVFRQIKLQA